jgi:beta-lactamase regulating signal transducer with metallopeptidase domain
MFYPELSDRDAGADGGGRAQTSPLALRNVLPWITPLWLIGALLFNLKHAASCIAAGRLRRRGVCPAPDAWQQRLGAIQGRLKIAKPVMLLESCLTQVPMVVGHLRPVILVPLGLLAGLPAGQVELILVHELAHIRRGDYIVNMIQAFVEGAMFFNPAVWWISKTIRSEREHCCDDIAANAAKSAHAYAAALTALAEHRSRPAPLAIAATGGNLMKRIRRVLHQPHPPASPRAPAIAAAVVIVVIAEIRNFQEMIHPYLNPRAAAQLSTTKLLFKL